MVDMFNNFRVGELDFVMLSFDEPNADDNFRDLQTIVPTAKRSHGVKGFDAAHRAAADKAETPVFVTVDADNVIDPKLLNFKVFNPRARDKFAISLNGINSTNGLVYGNGSIKIWAKKFIYEMNSHENRSEDDGTVDKCDKKSVDFSDGDELFYLVIAVVPSDVKKTTVNLKSPIVINRTKSTAAQIILDESYDIKFPIFREKGAD